MAGFAQDQAFTWTAEGRVIKVTAREIKRAIDKNDEKYVFGLIQAHKVTAAVGLIGLACWAGILARMIQASDLR